MITLVVLQHFEWYLLTIAKAAYLFVIFSFSVLVGHFVHVRLWYSCKYYLRFHLKKPLWQYQADWPTTDRWSQWIQRGQSDYNGKIRPIVIISIIITIYSVFLYIYEAYICYCWLCMPLSFLLCIRRKAYIHTYIHTHRLIENELKINEIKATTPELAWQRVSVKQKHWQALALKNTDRPKLSKCTERKHDSEFRET